MKPMAWMNAAFGEDYSLHFIFSRHPTVPGWGGYEFRHGYALVDGEVRGLKAGKVRATRTREYIAAGFEVRLTDVDDVEHVLFGIPVVQHPWTPYGNIAVAHTGLRWHTTGDHTGFGLSQELIPLDAMSGATFRNGGAPA
jgi:hypothetical protein